MEQGVRLIPFVGGLDLSTAATHAHPGTLQECLNFEVALTDGYRRIDGFQRYDGRTVPEFGSLYTLRKQYGFTEDGFNPDGLSDQYYSIGTGAALNSLIPVGTPLFFVRAISWPGVSAEYSVGIEGIAIEQPVFEERQPFLGEFVDLTVRTGLIFFPVTEGITEGVDEPNNPSRTYVREDIRRAQNFSGNIAVVNNVPEILEVSNWSDYNVRLNTTFNLNRQQVLQHPGGAPLGQHWFRDRLYSVAESQVFSIGEDDEDPPESTLDDGVRALVEEGQWFYYAADYQMVTQGPLGIKTPRSLITEAVSDEFLVTGRLMSVTGGDVELLMHEMEPLSASRGRAPIGSELYLLTEIKGPAPLVGVVVGNTITTAGGYEAIVRFVQIGAESTMLLVEASDGSIEVGDDILVGASTLMKAESVLGGSSQGNPLCVIGTNDPARNRGVLLRDTPDVGFEPMPMGYEIRFEDGENEPLAVSDRDDIEDAAGDSGILSSGSVGNQSLASGGSGWFIPSVGNLPPAAADLSSARKVEAAGLIEDDDSDFVACRMGPSRTHYLVIQDMGAEIDQFDRVTGIEITAQVGKGVNNHPLFLAAAGYYDPEGNKVWVREVNQPINVAVGAKTEVSVGGADELFRSGQSGQADLTPRLVNDRRFGVALQFRTDQTYTSTNVMDVRVHQVEVTVHYQNGSTQVWLYDGDDDLATLRVVHKYLEGGSWDDGDAKGVLSVSGTITNEIPAGTQIRNGPDGTGALITEATQPPQRSRLPNRQAMDREKSQFVFKSSNFFASDELEAVYGASGAGLPFTFADGYFFFFRTGVEEDLLKPRHINRIRDRLVLAYANGNFDISTPGEPLDFDGFTGGAATLGVGEKVTGLLQLQGEALAVFTENQIIGWYGADNDSFTSNVISPSSGAIEYTVADMGMPIFCDFRGIGTIQTSEKYGDFQTGRLSEAVHRWLSPRLQGTRRDDGQARSVAGVALVRNKSQYRVFFRDGWVLTMTMRADRPEFTTQLYKVRRDDFFRLDATQPEESCGVDGACEGPVEWRADIEPIQFRAACWGVTREGQDRIFLSADNYPHMIEIDRGNSFDGQAIESYVVTNPTSAGAPEMGHRFNVLHVHGRVNGFATLDHQVGINYALPGGRPVPFSLGSSSDPYEPGERPAFQKSRTDVVGRDISLRINHLSATEQPFVLQSYNWIDASPRKLER